MASPRDHRVSTPADVRDHRTPSVPPSAGPVARPPHVVHPIDQPPPIVQPPTVQPPAHEPAHPRHPHDPPRAHHEHQDYIFVEGYDWWPRWYPYWDPYWYQYWQYLFDYYGGAYNPDYAEASRDAYLRSIAPQWGWISQ